jgi:hypothetical protein
MGTREQEQAEQELQREEMQRQQQERNLQRPNPLMGNGDNETSTNPAIINKLV